VVQAGVIMLALIFAAVNLLVDLLIPGSTAHPVWRMTLVDRPRRVNPCQV